MFEYLYSVNFRYFDNKRSEIIKYRIKDKFSILIMLRIKFVCV
ncbi:hypothetical protein LV92_04342 [Arenibacter echinorum]|uniref:Uncharacterized protein n=1 Tax=Arenibacter echinorum TaxID=440515 RepID=A0A327QNB3_9FLAO|nr:hypothetical protein LV92_04342 [Arenibacter echinorum]